MSGLRFDNVSKRYSNGHLAVADLDLVIHDGGFLVVVGPSGCGKTTTLRMVAGLEDVTSGDIQLAARCINRLPPGERDVAMVFQNYSLYPNLSGRENLAFGLKTRKLAKSEIASRVAEAAELLSIHSLLDRRPEEMSGGERQRIALGRAIVRKPAVFLFDEPLSNLDAQLRLQMRVQIAELHKRLKTTTLYVTHDQSEAMALADSIAVLKEGVLQQVGTPAEVYDRPANQFVAGFLGSPAMNFVAGEIQDHHFRSHGVEYELIDAAVNAAACTIGFRPESVTLLPGPSKFADAKVVVVENVGSELIAHCRIGASGTSIAVRLPRQSAIAVDDKVTLYVSSDDLYFFDATGEII